MGWAGGIELLDKVFDVIKHHVTTDKDTIALQLVELFEDEDCDTICESDHTEILRAYRSLHPEYFEDEIR